MKISSLSAGNSFNFTLSGQFLGSKDFKAGQSRRQGCDRGQKGSKMWPGEGKEGTRHNSLNLAPAEANVKLIFFSVFLLFFFYPLAPGSVDHSVDFTSRAWRKGLRSQ